MFKRIKKIISNVFKEIELMVQNGSYLSNGSKLLNIYGNAQFFLKYILEPLSLNMNSVCEEFAPYLLLKMQYVNFIIVQLTF